VTTGTLADLRRHTRTHVHAVTVEVPAGLADAPGVAEDVSQQLDGRVDSRFTIDAEHLDAVVGLLHAARIQTLTVTPPSLDALFLRTYDGAAGAHESHALGMPDEALR
jgi:ABC-2 type transport system ATP-binding protein